MARPDWINSDQNLMEGVDVVSSILEGLPLKDGCIDSISSQHALQEIDIHSQVGVLQELRRVLREGGVLRLALPDLDRAIEAYRQGEGDYFAAHTWATLSGNFVTHILWHNFTRTLFTVEFAEELLRLAAFTHVEHVGFGVTISRHPEIVELDDREWESLFVEAVR